MAQENINEYPQRKPIRLKDYNYTQSGYYFVTICTYNHQLLFGKIVGSQRAVTAAGVHGICLNQYGKIAREEWGNAQWLRNDVDLDEYIIMPNHIHGIIIIHESDTVLTKTGTARCAPTTHYKGPVSGSLSAVIRSFKSAVTKRINELRQTTIPPIWQRSFHDHVIRTDTSLQSTRKYIINNPSIWDQDENNPDYKQTLNLTCNLPQFSAY